MPGEEPVSGRQGALRRIGGALREVPRSIVGLIASAGVIAGAWASIDAALLDSQPCRLSGVAISGKSQEPLAGALIGYAPDRNNVSLERLNNVTFRVLAVSGPAGSYKAECDDASDSQDSFEVLAKDAILKSGKPRCAGITYTGLRFRNEGDHEGVNVLVIGC